MWPIFNYDYAYQRSYEYLEIGDWFLFWTLRLNGREPYLKFITKFVID